MTTNTDHEAERAGAAPGPHPPVDLTEGTEARLRDLRASRAGLSSIEAKRRLQRYGPNELLRPRTGGWVRELLHQFTHPLALLLWAASALAWAAGITPVAIAVIVVILINAAFAFVQEQQAERAVDALAAYLPVRAVALRDGKRATVDAASLVPGDVILIEEGARVSADCQLLEGAVEVDLSTLTGESAPVERAAGADQLDAPQLQRQNRVYSGTTCIGGEALGLVIATGMHTELGRIAALSTRISREESPLEHQVRLVAWLIAAIAIAMGVAFVPIAMLGGLGFSDAVVLAIGLLVGNVPEGLLPVITLSLAVAVRSLARSGALVKRLSAVETLGSTSVICTDKTGTLTENRMHATTVWTDAGVFALADGSSKPVPTTPQHLRLAVAAADCNNAELAIGSSTGDPTELAMLEAASAFGVTADATSRNRRRQRELRFDPARKLMTTISEREGELIVDTKGAPEAVLPCCVAIAGDGGDRELTDGERDRISEVVDSYAGTGLRVLAVAGRPALTGDLDTSDRDDVEKDLTLIGLIAMLDPPRPEVADAVARCHRAGIRILVVTGDHGLTAAAIARSVGIAGENPRIIDGAELDTMSDRDLSTMLAKHSELIFSRSSPEAKLRIADALRDGGEVVAMTGDGVNDAPALRAADIGVAMGRSGTDVAREASTIVLTDDNFATIVSAIEDGRRVYDNIRKFIFYIFAHTTPEVVPFLVFGIAGGAVPLPLTVMQLLAFDVGTETLPALALGREPAEPGVMSRPPRPRSENIVSRAMLVRAWLFLGVISAALSVGAFFLVLQRAGWNPGDPTGEGHPLHDDYVRATTITFLGMLACQVGTAVAARTERASLRQTGLFSNHLLLWGIAFEIAFAAVLVTVPPFQNLLGTATPHLSELVLILPFPFIVWGADEFRRMILRRRDRKQPAG